MFCTKCGKSINDGSKFCSNCGSTISNTQNNKKTSKENDDINGMIFSGNGGEDYLVTHFNKDVLKKWRIALTVIYIIWFFIGGEIAEKIADSGFGQFIILILSYGILCKVIETLIYRPYVFPKIYDLTWTKELDKIIHHKK